MIVGIIMMNMMIIAVVMGFVIRETNFSFNASCCDQNLSFNYHF